MKKLAQQALKPSLAALYRTLWHYAAGDRRRVVAFMAMLVAAQLVKLAIPYCSGIAVSAMQAGDLRAAGIDMGLIFVACLASWALHGPARVIERFVAIRIRERYADTLFAKAVGLPLAWHERNHSGDTIRRVEKAGAALFGFSQNQFVYLQNFVSLVGPIVAIFLISLPTGIAAVLGYGFIAIMLMRFDRIVMRLNRAQNRAERRYSSALVDTLGNIATVQTLRLGPATRRVLAERLAAVFAPLRSNVVMNETKWFAVDILNNGIRCGLVVLYAWLIYRDSSTLLLGSAVMVFQYAQQVGGVVSSMAGNWQDLVQYQTDLACIGPLAAAQAPPAGSNAVPPRWQEIRTEDLSFTYPGARGGRLDRVSLTLRRGSRIALVGMSGSGKSTLLRVLSGLYPPEDGSFVVDGKSEPELVHLGAISTLIPQDPEIFAGTIGHNVTLGIRHAAADLRRACELAQFTPVLETLPAGLDTDIAERGLNLSGGQKQRLALARGILAAGDSSLILLDEPTSSLDAETESQVYDNLLSAFPDACVVSSIHRLHLLDRFDAVVLMGEGRILAAGTVAELMDGEPRFRALVERYAATGRRAPPIAA